MQVAADALRHAGFRVEEFRPDGLEKARQLWWKYFGIAGGMLLRPLVSGHESDLSPVLKQFMGWVSSEPSHTADSLLDAWIQRDLVRMKIFAQMNEYPILLCPTAAIAAFRHGERSWQIDGATVKYLDAWSYTEWFNLLGNPAVTVPVGQSNKRAADRCAVGSEAMAGGIAAFNCTGVGVAIGRMEGPAYCLKFCVF